LPNLPSKAIVGKSFHGCGFHSPPVRWWVESQELSGTLKDLTHSFHSFPVRWWVERIVRITNEYWIGVSTALPLGGGLKILMIEDTTLAI